MLVKNTVLINLCGKKIILFAFWCILVAKCDEIVRENEPGRVWLTVNRTNTGNIPEHICKLSPCVPKCCPGDERITMNGTCKSGGTRVWEIFKIPIHKRSRNGSLLKVGHFSEDRFTVLQGIPCPSGSRYRLDKFVILETGNLFDIRGNIESTTIDYCIDYLDSIDKVTGFVCFPPDDKEAVSFRYYPIGMLSSVVFLSATLLVYLLLPQLRNINGLCLMCHVTSLAIGYIFLAIVQLGGSDIPLNVCKLLAYTVVFSFLASFFWLNVMCFDIWWVFSGVGKSQRQVKRGGVDGRKFAYYSIYSWGCPTAIVGFIILMESSLVSRYFFLPKPDFGKTKCWFETKLAMWTYFYAPVAAILICNLFFFITTTIKILQISRETRVLNHDGNKRHDEKEKQRFVLYLKLFLVMGVSWLSEVVSFHFNDVKELSVLWIVADIGNTLQGIPIFLIFVCKRKTLLLLNQRLCPGMKLIETSQASTKSRETNISNNNCVSAETNRKRLAQINSIELNSFSPKNLPSELIQNN